MSLRTFIDVAPLGALLLVSNGQPRPPERFNRKLSNWKSENYAGTLVAIETAPGQRPTFTVREGQMDEKAAIVFQRRYGFDTSLRFEVQRRPMSGEARVVRASRRELLHMAADHAEAVKWLADNLISDAVIEIVIDLEAEVSEEAA
ncbi:MAG: hypothetical protein ABW179_12485 [Methylobacterium sp.]